MHQLERPEAPTCLSKYRHSRHQWKDLTAEDKNEIWQQLEKMQLKRCAYCECKMILHPERQDVHIEHFRPKSTYPQGTFEWKNLFGSCIHQDSCGRHKDHCGPYDTNDLIKPDEEDPEAYFLFVSDGTIVPRQGLSEKDKKRAEVTLQVFNLDAKHGRLQSMRRSAVSPYLDTAETLLEIAQAYGEDAYNSSLQGELEDIKALPFVTAIKHVLMGVSTKLS